MISRDMDFKKANQYADTIAFFFWMVLLGLIIYMKMALFIFSLLFSLFVFMLVDFILLKIRVKSKILSTIIAVALLSGIFYMGYKGASYMVQDLVRFLQASEATIFETMREYGLEKDILSNISTMYSQAMQYAIEHFGILKDAGGALLKSLLGIVFGVIIFYSRVELKEKPESLADLSLQKIYNFSFMIFDSFRNIMLTQIIISILNTITISIFALGITYFYSGAFLPFWYILIPFVTIFSLLPVIGNIIVNILIALASLQVGVYYIFIALIYFFIVHKGELIIIGKFLHRRMNVPFLLILFSMVIGELIFSSVVGIILGMVMLFVTISLLNSYKLEGVQKRIEG